MSNFSGENGRITYTEPEGTPIYRGAINLTPEYQGEKVALCIVTHGDGESVALGVRGEDDVQQFLYSAAVQSKLIKDGDPLILMKKITTEAEDAA